MIYVIHCFFAFTSYNCLMPNYLPPPPCNSIVTSNCSGPIDKQDYLAKAKGGGAVARLWLTPETELNNMYIFAKQGFI